DGLILLVEVHQSIAGRFVVEQFEDGLAIFFRRVSDGKDRHVVAERIEVVTGVRKSWLRPVLNRASFMIGTPASRVSGGRGGDAEWPVRVPARVNTVVDNRGQVLVTRVVERDSAAHRIARFVASGLPPAIRIEVGE